MIVRIINNRDYRFIKRKKYHMFNPVARYRKEYLTKCSKHLSKKRLLKQYWILLFWIVTTFPIVLFAFAFVMFREYDMSWSRKDEL